MTFNIRVVVQEKDFHDNWGFRKNEVADLIRRRGPDLAGLQEVLPSQAKDLASRLDQYQWFGVPRDDGKDLGEMCAIFYRPARLELLDKGTFWLSLSPETPGSISWFAACRRVVTWGKFHDRVMNRDFFLFNTHFDAASQFAREESAKLLVQKIPLIAGQVPVIITGDFNCPPGTKPYQTITASYQDARKISVSPPQGPEGTVRSFALGSDILPSRIDYIFVVPAIKVHSYTVIDDVYGTEQRRPSDHMPVMASLSLP
jgi:endonuclease/exonuclease/phosphatase family metal-dependent hydrolase